MAHGPETPVGGVIPYLTIPSRGGQAAIEFYRAALGAEELFRNMADDGERVMHARLLINGGLIFLSDAFAEFGYDPEAQPRGVAIHLQVDDAEEWWARALVAGGIPVVPLADMFWGDRYGQFRDPFGHCWSVGSAIKKA